MGRILDELRAEYQLEEEGRKWWQPRPKGDAMLYLSARLRDAENEARANLELAYYWRTRFQNYALKYNDLETIEYAEKNKPLNRLEK